MTRRVIEARKSIFLVCFFFFFVPRRTRIYTASLQHGFSRDDIGQNSGIRLRSYIFIRFIIYECSGGGAYVPRAHNIIYYRRTYIVYRYIPACARVFIIIYYSRPDFQLLLLYIVVYVFHLLSRTNFDDLLRPS